LDHWTLNGDHRLISLKCGHLFGLSCVKRWLQECNAGSKSCPTCKTKVVMRDIRNLYAKRVQAVDNTEEVRLREDLDKERNLRNHKEIELNLTRYELEVQRNLNKELTKKIEILQSRGVTIDVANPSDNPYETYKLFLEKNIEISRDGGCRVMMYGKKLESLIVSQKSAQALFPGYGVRFIDAATFRLCQFLHVSNQKSVRDLGINYDEDRMITATMDKGAKLFDIHNKSVVNVFTPSESPLWACSFERDPNKMNFLYLGTNSTFVYDIRQPATFIREFKTEGDHTPILSIVPIPGTDDIPFGGILVCKLQSLWFFEYTASQEVAASRLHVEGPFLAVTYDEMSKYLLISTRPSQKFTQARYIVARLAKQNQYNQLNVVTTLVGSKVQSQITRCTQINTGKNTVVAAYLQDTKMLTTWNLSNPDSKMQSLPSSETILDLCPVRLGNHLYLAALTDSKCRIYNMVT
jgi:E3 ubiquitin-protein ligase RFWD3